MEKIDLSVKSNRFGYFSQSLRKAETDGYVARYLKPLMIFLKCIGIEWARENEDRPRDRIKYFVQFIGWLFFAQSIGVYILYSFFIPNSFFQQNLTNTLNLIIIYTNEILFKAVNHLSLLFLAGSFRQLQLVRIFRQLDYPGLKIRQSSKKLLLALFLVS